MLLQMAIGDAYGAGFEYANAEVVAAHNDLSTYIRRSRHAIKPGAYTDDTQMGIAIAETMVSGDPWTAEVLAGHFVSAFKRDQRQGYAERFYNFLRHVQDGAQFLAEIDPDSDKSGAAMRACPIGIYPTIAMVIERCTVQARITHNTPNGIGAANAAALMTHYFVYKLGPKDQLGAFLEATVPGNWALPWQGKVRSKGWMSVRAAITAMLRNDRMSDLLRECIAVSGDVDSVATIALAAGSCSDEITQALPEHLFWRLENGRYGRDYLQELARLLEALRVGFDDRAATQPTNP
ncbi:MAG: ADP-ribosylglycohydrolase family protein [Chloroflexota bacterium]